MFWLVIASLILIGLLSLVLEILVIPGSGVAGVIGFILLAIGVWQAYTYYGTPTGHYVLVGTIVFSLLTLVLSLRSKTWNRIMLHDNIGGRVNVREEGRINLGDEGKTISRVNPSGKALINNEYYEVRTNGEFIDPGTTVIIEKLERNKIFVKPKE